jgi:DNA-binding transcriptional ArsR family regulator
MTTQTLPVNPLIDRFQEILQDSEQELAAMAKQKEDLIEAREEEIRKIREAYAERISYLEETAKRIDRLRAALDPRPRTTRSAPTEVKSISAETQERVMRAFGGEPRTRVQLAETSGLNQSTVGNAIGYLRQLGYVRLKGEVPRDADGRVGGRLAALYALTPVGADWVRGLDSPGQPVVEATQVPAYV